MTLSWLTEPIGFEIAESEKTRFAPFARPTLVPKDSTAHNTFYLDCTQEPYCKNFNMYSYITSELPGQLYASFSELDSSRVSITGYSMGGAGALMMYFRNPGMYRSVSALAPIADLRSSATVRMMLTEYLGKNEEDWKKWNPSDLVGEFEGDLDILIDQGTSDVFFTGDNEIGEKLLQPDQLLDAAKKANKDQGITLRYHNVGPLKLNRLFSSNETRIITTPTILSPHLRRIM